MDPDQIAQMSETALRIELRQVVSANIRLRADNARLREERDDADNYIRAIWRKDLLPAPLGSRLFDRLTKS